MDGGGDLRHDAAIVKRWLRNPYVLGFLVGIATITALRPFLRHVPAPPPVIGRLPDWTLVDADGAPFGSANLTGGATVVSFFSTRCTEVCPEVMDGMAKLQEGFEVRGIDGARLVSITVDPEHDTPEVLRAYASAHGVHPKTWTLVTGDPARVRELVLHGFAVPLPAGDARPADPEEVAHAGKLVLVDGSGGIRGYYGTGDMGLDEVFNRTQHVLRVEREQRRRR